MFRIFITIFSVLLFTSFAYSADFVKYDANNRIIKVYDSVDGFKQGLTARNDNDATIPNVLHITRDEVKEAKKKYRKIDLTKPVGQRIIPFTQAEINAVLQAESDAQKQALLNSINKYEISNLDLITALVKRINVRIPNNPISKQEIINEIKASKGL